MLQGLLADSTVQMVLSTVILEHEDHPTSSLHFRKCGNSHGCSEKSTTDSIRQGLGLPIAKNLSVIVGLSSRERESD